MSMSPTRRLDSGMAPDVSGAVSRNGVTGRRRAQGVRGGPVRVATGRRAPKGNEKRSEAGEPRRVSPSMEGASCVGGNALHASTRHRGSPYGGLVNAGAGSRTFGDRLSA